MSNETIAITAVGATLLAATVGMGAFTFNAISGVRTEVAVLRTDVAELRTEVRTDVAELRTEVRADVAELRTEVRSDVAELRTDMADLRERMARLEGLFEGFTGRTGDAGSRAAPAPHEMGQPA